MAQTVEGPQQRVTTSPLAAFVRASCLHIGAAGAAASLRHDLVGRHNLTTHDIDAAYAVSRVTPGTNLLALYALLGHRLGGWRLALEVVAVGALLPASLAVVIAYAYSHSTSPMLTALMAGARAGGVAVFFGAAIRLLKPQLVAHPHAGVAFVGLAFLATWAFPVSLFVVLLAAGACGAIWLRSASS
jgi:chromate transport protein ChrA